MEMISIIQDCVLHWLNYLRHKLRIVIFEVFLVVINNQWQYYIKTSYAITYVLVCYIVDSYYLVTNWCNLVRISLLIQYTLHNWMLICFLNSCKNVNFPSSITIVSIETNPISQGYHEVKWYFLSTIPYTCQIRVVHY